MSARLHEIMGIGTGKPQPAVYSCMPAVVGIGKHVFTVCPRKIFRPGHFTIEAGIAPFFLVHDVSVHRWSAFRSSDPMPGSCFTPLHRVELSYETCNIGGHLSASVSRRPMRIVCQAKDGCDYPPIGEIDPPLLRALHPKSGKPTGSIDFLWDGWKIPDWIDARVSDCYQRIADVALKRKELVERVGSLVLEGGATGRLDEKKAGALLSEILAFEEEHFREALADYAGEPFRDDLEFRGWFEGLEVDG